MPSSPEHTSRLQYEWNLRRRRAVLEMLGGKCRACGEDEEIVLQIDHINPIRRGGRAILSGSNTIGRLLSGSLAPSEVQILCANCHVRKTKKENSRRKYAL